MDKALWIFGIVSAGLIGLLMACCVVAGRSDEADGKSLEENNDDRNWR